MLVLFRKLITRVLPSLKYLEFIGNLVFREHFNVHGNIRMFIEILDEESLKHLGIKI